jgi:hypothetical protein
MPALLFSTIPLRHVAPRRATVASDGPQAAVIRSWLESGFTPVSINRADEIARHPHAPAALHACGVEMVVLPPGDGATAGPLCPLVDFLRAVHDRVGDAPLVIVNADIALAAAPAGALATTVARLPEGAHLVAQRTDLSRDRRGRQRAVVFPHGVDLVAMRGSWIPRVIPFLAPDLAFGRPWWDHYLPLALMALGSRTHLVDPAWCRHEVHPVRWNKRQFCAIGRVALEHFRGTVARGADLPAAGCPTDVIDSALFRGFVPGPVATRMLGIAAHPATPDFVTASIMKRLAAAHMRLIVRAAHHGNTSAAASVTTPSGP